MSGKTIFHRRSNLVEVYIGYLRKKLKPHNLDQKISTVRGYGYRWDDE